MAVDPLQQIRIAGLLQSSFQGSVPQDGEARAVPVLRPGSEITAKVVAQLLDGRVVLDVEGAPFQTRLPQGVSAGLGSRIPLLVIEGGETPTFGLAGPQADSPAPSSARVALSGLSTQLQALAAAAKRDAAPAAVTGQPPLLPTPPADGAALEAPLRAALEHSGLFYESHQADWVAGQRDLASLRQEPQARLARIAAAGEGGPDAVADAREPDAASRTSATASETPMGGGSPDTDVSGAPGTASLPPGVATLVDRQLQNLGTQQIHWSGPVWPGQTMEWEVREEGRDSADPSAPATWTSRLRLELPRLGEVEAVLRLRGGALAVELRVPEGARAEVGAGTTALRDSLDARGLSLESLALQAAGDG